MKKKLRITPEDRAHWAETQRRLAERIAYHEAKIAEQERRAQQKPLALRLLRAARGVW